MDIKSTSNCCETSGLSLKKASDCCDKVVSASSCSVEKPVQIIEEKVKPCPICGNSGRQVELITVEHMVRDDLADRVDKNAAYVLCLDRTCDVVYYDQNSAFQFYQKDINVPVWFKMNADPKYACYCNQITEDQVIKVVSENNMTDMPEIMKFLRGTIKSQCEIKNPAGKCCTQAFHEAIQKGLTLRVPEKG